MAALMAAPVGAGDDGHARPGLEDQGADSGQVWLVGEPAEPEPAEPLDNVCRQFMRHNKFTLAFDPCLTHTLMQYSTSTQANSVGLHSAHTRKWQNDMALVHGQVSLQDSHHQQQALRPSSVLPIQQEEHDGPCLCTWASQNCARPYIGAAHLKRGGVTKTSTSAAAQMLSAASSQVEAAACHLPAPLTLRHT